MRRDIWTSLMAQILFVAPDAVPLRLTASMKAHKTCIEIVSSSLPSYTISEAKDRRSGRSSHLPLHKLQLERRMTWSMVDQVSMTITSVCRLVKDPARLFECTLKCSIPLKEQPYEQIYRVHFSTRVMHVWMYCRHGARHSVSINLIKRRVVIGYPTNCEDLQTVWTRKCMIGAFHL